MADLDKVSQVDADEVEGDENEGVTGPDVYVELNCPGWVRHDFKTGRTTRLKRGERLYITRQEFDTLQNSRFPTVRQVNED